MIGHARIVLAASSVAIVAGVVAVATALGPGGPWLFVLSILAIISAVQGASAEPRDLGLALLFGAIPVAALVADGSPSWLIGPLGVGLLVSGELNALSWDCRGRRPLDAVKWHRLLRIGQLASFGLLASLSLGMVGVAAGGEGILTVLLAALALVGLGYLVLGRKSQATGFPLDQGTFKDSAVKPRRPGRTRPPVHW